MMAEPALAATLSGDVEPGSPEPVVSPRDQFVLPHSDIFTEYGPGECALDSDRLDNDRLDENMRALEEHYLDRHDRFTRTINTDTAGSEQIYDDIMKIAHKYVPRTFKSMAIQELHHGHKVHRDAPAPMVTSMISKFSKVIDGAVKVRAPPPAPSAASQLAAMPSV